MKMKRLKEKVAWALVIAMTMATPFAALAGSVSLEGTLGVDYKLVKLNAGDKATFSDALKASPSEASPSQLDEIGASDTTIFQVNYRELGVNGNEEVFYMTKTNLEIELETAKLLVPEGKSPIWLEEKGNLDSKIEFDPDHKDGYEVKKDITNLYLDWQTEVNTAGVEQLEGKKVEVLGLPEGKTMTVADLQTDKRYATEKLEQVLGNAGNTYKGIDAEKTLQLDMNVADYQGSGVKVMMELPEGFANYTRGKSVVVIHFGKKTEIITPEEIRNDDGSVEQIGFTLKDFSPVVVAVVEKMVDVRIENVKGGYLYAYSGDLWDIDENGKRPPVTFVPIGETVKVPAGTRLWVDGASVGNSKLDEILVSEDGKTVPLDASAYLIEADETIFTGVFSEQPADEENRYPMYRVRKSPNTFEPGKIKTQLKALYCTEEEKNGREVAVSDWKLEASEYDDSNLFTLTPEGVLESKSELEAGSYSMNVNFVHAGKTIESMRVRIDVGLSADFSMYLGYSQVGSETWIEEIWLDGDIYAKGTSIGDIKRDLSIAGWNPGLYGYEFAGWMSMTENNRMKLVEDTDVLSDDLYAYARFKKADGSYYDPKFQPLEGSDTPDVDPSDPSIKPGGGSSSSSSSGGSGSTGASNTMFGTWVQDEYGWKFLQTNGSYAAGQWGMIQGIWYLFGEDAYMKTGWVNWNERWYYLDETKGSGEGAMLVGWQLIKDKWYYLNPISDGTRGAMLSNQWVGDYFLDVDGSWVEGRTK